MAYNANLESTYDVALDILGELGGDTSKKYDSLYSIALAILAAIEGGGGGGGSVVSWNQLVDEGTKIAQIIINGQSTDVYAPAGGSGDVTKEYVDEEIARVEGEIPELVDNLEDTSADKAISARAVNVDLIDYIDQSISDTMNYIMQEDAAEHAGRVAGDELLQAAIDEKQDELVSGTNIKTINGESVLGSGNIVISGGGSTVTIIDYDNIDTALALDIFENPLDYIIRYDKSALQTLYFRYSEDLNNYKNFCTIPQVASISNEYDLHETYKISIDYLGQKQFNTIQQQYYDKDYIDTHLGDVEYALEQIIGGSINDLEEIIGENTNS